MPPRQLTFIFDPAGNRVNPNLATLNSRNETYGFCRHRKKYLLKYVKPLAFKGGALTYRYKD